MKFTKLICFIYFLNFTFQTIQAQCNHNLWSGSTFSPQPNTCINKVIPNNFVDTINGVATIKSNLACNNSYYYPQFLLKDSLSCISNNFAIEFRIRNSYNIGGIADYDLYFNLYAKNDTGLLNTSLAIMDTLGRQQFTKASFGAIEVTNSPSLLRNLSYWRVVKIHYNNNLAVFSIDGIIMETIPYVSFMKRIDSLSIGFKGAGQVDWIRILNNDTEIWREDFNSVCFSKFPNLCIYNSICDDICNWNLKGNNILLGQNSVPINIFGTLNNSDIRILTNNTDRGVITANGWLGWNTIPSSLFHINSSRLFNNPSAIRFQNLPIRDGYILVTDSDGYIYRSNSYSESLYNKIEELEQKVNLLVKQINALKEQNNKGYIKQNVPNPVISNSKTIIEYGIEKANGPCYLLITDLTGRQVNKIQLNASLKLSQIELNNNQLNAGLYLYSLIIAGEIIDTKKMIISK